MSWMIKSRRTMVAIALAGAASLGLTACGGPPELDEISQNAAKKMEDATSVRMELENVQTSDGSVSGEVSGQLDDSNYEIQQDVTGGDKDYSWERVKVSEEEAYFKGDPEAYAANNAQALGELAADQWVPVTDADQQVGLATIYDQIVTGFSDGDFSGLKDVESEETDLDGEKVYLYTGKDESDQTVHVYYTENEELRRVEVENENSETEAVNFFDWNEVDAVTAPDDAEILSGGDGNRKDSDTASANPTEESASPSDSPSSDQ